MSNQPMSPRDHSHYQDLLEKHISGEAVSPDARIALLDHIETCDECRLILEAEERITARMKSVPRLVAPVDLRARILNQAVRDHRERTTTPSEDPAVADLLKPVPVGRSAGLTSSEASARKDMEQSSAPAGEFPVFAGIVAPRPGRLRRAWRRASPVMATGFLFISSIGALYTGQFQGIPVAGDAQKFVWAMVDAARGKDDPYMRPSSTGTSPLLSPPPPPIAVAGLPGSTAPLPGTATVSGFIKDARAWAASADSTVAALARASADAVPSPAEKAVPQIAALVLRPTDRNNALGGFRESELAAALEAVAETQPGGRVTQHDQFAMDGHRYRMYTLQLPAGCTHQIVQTLTPYQAPADGGIINVLASQNQVNVSRNDNIRFFSSNEHHLRSALENITPVSASTSSESIRVVVVE